MTLFPSRAVFFVSVSASLF